MTVSSERATVQVGVQIRIPRQVRVSAGISGQIGTSAGATLEISSFALEKRGSDEHWFTLQLQGAIAGGQRNIELVLGSLRCEGFLADPTGMTLPVVFQSSSDAGAASLVPAPHPEEPRTRTRLRVRIPENFQQEPILSNLVARHGLSVNILGALLGTDARGDGWFDLELRGTPAQTASGLEYLDQMDLQIWPEASSEDDW